MLTYAGRYAHSEEYVRACAEEVNNLNQLNLEVLRPEATSVCGLKLLVYAALSY
jgi:predicted TPR repeat methyltransferase